jgi:NAD(P)H-hydrate epimerase
VKIVLAEVMREIDRRTIGEAGIPGLRLMERAGAGVYKVARRCMEEARSNEALVICGRGNNGGDGFVAARMLHLAGFDVSCWLIGSSEELRGDAAKELQAAVQAGLRVQESACEDLSDLRASVPGPPQAGKGPAVVVDALLGTGTRGPVEGQLGRAIELLNELSSAGARVISVDIPSAMEADTGKPASSQAGKPAGPAKAACPSSARDAPPAHSQAGKALGLCVRADETVTMGLPKLGLLAAPGLAGRVHVVDIGVPAEIIQEAEAAAELIEPAQVRRCFPRRRRDAHKGDFGRVLVVAGSVGMTGAAALCSEAALRIGAGLVYLAVPMSLNDIMEVKLTEVITRPVAETPRRTFSAEALPQIEELAQGCDAVALGPGIGQSEELSELVAQLVQRLDRPLVLDADGLNNLSARTARPGAELLRQRQFGRTVITPHPGELGRLLGLSPAEVQSDRFGAASSAAERFGCIVALKGAATLVAQEGKLTHVSPTGNPGMASGGTGDVLTGMIVGLVAQGVEPFEAACAGVYLHGLAGDVAAQQVTEACLTAGELLQALPEAVRKVMEEPQPAWLL